MKKVYLVMKTCLLGCRWLNVQAVCESEADWMLLGEALLVSFL